MKILALSDIVVDAIYTPQIAKRFPDIEIVIGCGDLPYYYLEFTMTALNVPLYYVRGNHAHKVEYTIRGEQTEPQGGCDLHRRNLIYKNLLMAGVEGSLRYRPGPYQYSSAEMWGHVFSLVPGFFQNKIRYQRYLDIFISHAPPKGIHDQEDPAHQGVAAFNWLIKVFKPRYHLHGHIHVYHPWVITETQVNETLVVNAFGHKKIDLDTPGVS